MLDISPPSCCDLPLAEHIRRVYHDSRDSYIDGLIAIILILLSQLMISALNPITSDKNAFPASVVAMIIVSGVFIMVSSFLVDVDKSYAAYLKKPTDLINRHMSIGFIVPFIMIMDATMPSGRNVGLVIAGFVATGLLNTVLVYLFSFGLQTLFDGTIRKFASSSKLPEQPAESRNRPCTYLPGGSPSPFTNSRPVQNNSHPRPPAPASPQYIPDIQQGGSQNMSSVSFRTVGFIGANPVFCGCVFGIVAIGLPVAKTTGDDTALDTFVLLSLWMGTLKTQATVKRSQRMAQHPQWRNALAASLNAVLWSSLAVLVYMVAKASAKHTSVAKELRAFSTGTALADLVDAAGRGSAKMGAGDVATTILESGIVIWGLKLFECRKQLISWAGLTTLIASAVFALANIVCGPLLVHAMGLTPASHSLAFAARSVTIALSGPAMVSLGGDIGLNAALVVFSGIAFQVIISLGFANWVTEITGGCRVEFSWRRSSTNTDPDLEAALKETTKETTKECCIGGQTTPTDSIESDTIFVDPGPGISGGTQKDTPKLAGDNIVTIQDGACNHDANAGRTAMLDPHDSPVTVATGLAVGMNSAAMGTAYLYEDGSRSAPYSALAMTLFGVMTVVFTSIRGLDDWLIRRVSG